MSFRSCACFQHRSFTSVEPVGKSKLQPQCSVFYTVAADSLYRIYPYQQYSDLMLYAVESPHVFPAQKPMRKSELKV